MLTLTENASSIVNQIIDGQGLGESAGLRITTGETPERGLEVTAAPQAEPGDQVVEQGGASIYLDEAASQLLEDQVLDASVDSAGMVAFSVTPQA
jgi:iron-sulfur cluster assembly protein